MSESDTTLISSSIHQGQEPSEYITEQVTGSITPTISSPRGDGALDSSAPTQSIISKFTGPRTRFAQILMHLGPRVEEVFVMRLLAELIAAIAIDNETATALTRMAGTYSC